ncbi:MAG TPA: hypothetical protein VFA82_00430 [Gaiellaceae bacterium]|nr:hypothetical protein [Gaiellaceae bacterium]
MRRLLLLLCAPFVLLALPASLPAAGSAPSVAIFYYPWYGTAAHDGQWQHWGQDGHTPPDDIAAAYYPADGVYSSDDTAEIARQMDEIRSAGVDQVVVSWWGRGSPEDARLPLVLTAARADQLSVAVHLEPYAGRTLASVVADVAYLNRVGVGTIYVYEPFDGITVSDWATARVALHAGGEAFYAETPMVGAAAAAGFDGVYTYDIVTYGGRMFGRLCQEAHRHHLLCAPSVGPGYDARRSGVDQRVKPRRDGFTYDAMWRAAITARPDFVTVTSFNEWHEGTQIEPAAPRHRHGLYRYGTYDGAWGLHGAAAQVAYLARTAYWASVFRKTSPEQLKTRQP